MNKQLSSFLIVFYAMHISQALCASEKTFIASKNSYFIHNNSDNSFYNSDNERYRFTKKLMSKFTSLSVPRAQISLDKNSSHYLLKYITEKEHYEIKVTPSMYHEHITNQIISPQRPLIIKAQLTLKDSTEIIYKTLKIESLISQ